MPEDREFRQRVRHRRQSMRAASKATRQALGELPTFLRGRATTATRPILKQSPEFLALATHPSVTWGTSAEGKLWSRNIRGTARHEVAHHLGAGHPAMRAIVGSAGAGLSRRELVESVRIQREPMERRLQRATRSRAPWGTAPK